MKKKGIIILCSVIALCAIGLVSSHFIDWPVDLNDADGDIAKATRFSREQASEKLTNMEELLQTDSAFKDGIVVAQVVMQTRAIQFASLVDMSNEVAGGIPAYADVLKDMNDAVEIVTNANNSLEEAGGVLDAALDGKECPDLEQNTINAAMAYTTLQKQNTLADRFIEVTDKYLETAQGDDRLKLVRDQWLEYQQMTAALGGDKASAEALAKKGNLLSGEKTLSALASFSLAERLAVLQSSSLAQRIDVPNQIGSSISSKVLESEIGSVLAGRGRKIDSYKEKDVLAGRGRKIDSYKEKDVLAGRGRKIDSNSATIMNSASKVMEAYNAAIGNVANNLANNLAQNQSQNIGVSQRIGLVISQTAIGNRPSVSLIPGL